MQSEIQHTQYVNISDKGRAPSLVLTGAKIVLPDEVIEGSVRVIDGEVFDVAQGRSAVPEAVDLMGDYLLPGLVELHTDNLEKHVVPRRGVQFNPVLAAIAHDGQMISAGITTVLDSIFIGATERNPDRNNAMKPMVEGIRSAQSQNLLRADHKLHMRCELTHPNVVDLFAAFATDPLIRLISVMDHSPGQRQSPDVENYKKKEFAKSGLSQEEIDRTVEELIHASKTFATRHRSALTGYARDHHIPVASHDDETVVHVEQAADEGVIISEFPTTMEAAAAARAHGMQVLMGSPNILRGGSHSGNISAVSVAKAGLLDIISSDYIPISLLQAAFALTEEAIGYSLPSAVRTVTLNPAQAVGLADRGAIAAGRRADLVRVGMAGSLPVIRAVWVQGRQTY